MCNRKSRKSNTRLPELLLDTGQAKRKRLTPKPLFPAMEGVTLPPCVEISSPVAESFRE